MSLGGSQAAIAELQTAQITTPFTRRAARADLLAWKPSLARDGFGSFHVSCEIRRFNLGK